jgi:RNA polymerase sigma-70 factor (ECF subfamily)
MPVGSRRRSASREIPDEALMARYADGEADAFDELFRRYEPRAYAYFFRRTGSRERAQDLYQELFLRIHRARDRYDAERPFAPWLFQIAHRLLVDDARRAHRSHEVPLAREPRAEAADGEGRLRQRELLGEALAGLSREERHILVSTKLEGVAYAELAAQLGKSAAAVRKVASRALQRLRAAPLLAASLPAESR